MRILFNDGHSDLSEDRVCLLQYINDFTKGMGYVKAIIDPGKCERVLRMTRDPSATCWGEAGLAGASVFKKVANFVTYFVAEQPLPDPFPPGTLSAEIAKIQNHQNAILAFHVAIDNLKKATIKRPNDEELNISNPIIVSKHSYVDIIDALSTASPSAHFKQITILFEQLVYKTNPHCQYQDVISL